jgi:hypothetical protein
MNILLFAIFLLLACQTIAIFLAVKWFKNTKKSLQDSALSYFESPGDGKPSQFATFVDLVAQNFSSRFMQSARAQIANMSSIDKRQGDKIEAAGLAESLPGALAGIPGVGKMMQKNPLLGLAAQYLASRMGNQASNQPSQSNPTSNNVKVETPFSL